MCFDDYSERRSGQCDDDHAAQFEQLAVFLREQADIDLRSYEPEHVLRRLDRFLAARGLSSVQEIVALAKVSPIPRLVAKQVRDAIIVTVTAAMRDDDVLPAFVDAICDGRRADASRPASIWCAACASGEEAFSLAMLAWRAQFHTQLPGGFRLLGSDIDAHGLSRASHGLLSHSACERVPGELRGFVEGHPEAEDRRVIRPIRDCCTFELRDLTRSAPEGPFDAVSCRNLLRYLTRDAQRALLVRVRTAMQPEGLLLLGVGETPDALEGAFERAHRVHPIFRRID